MISRPITCTALVVLVFLGSAPAAQREGPVKHVVVLYPESDGRPGIIRFEDGLRSVFTLADDCVIEIYVEYLDATRFPDDGYRRQYAEFLRKKYQNIRVDLIVSPMRPSLDFLMKYREVCFPGIPVVYTAVEERELETLKPGAGFFGQPMRFESTATLELALRLQPGAKQVYAIFGNTEYDKLWVERTQLEFEKYADRLSFTYLTGLSLGELEAASREFPPDSIVYYFHVFSDRHGVSYTPAYFLERLAGRINHPMYGHVETYLGRGIVGGRLMSFETEGRHAAQLALALLKGGGRELGSSPLSHRDSVERRLASTEAMGIARSGLTPRHHGTLQGTFSLGHLSVVRHRGGSRFVP